MFRVKNHDSDTIQNYHIVIGIFVVEVENVKTTQKNIVITVNNTVIYKILSVAGGEEGQ